MMRFDRHRAVLAAGLLVGWTTLWFMPWRMWLESWPLVRTLIALVLFLQPGVALHAWLTDRAAVRPSGRVTYGFALSVVLTGILGLAGCLIHLPFSFVTTSFWVVGLLGPAAVWRAGHLAPVCEGNGHGSRDTVVGVEWLVLIVVLLLAGWLACNPAGGGDNFTHVARITRFLQADTLGFESVGFGDSVLIPPRYWLAYWPLCEALMVAQSGVHGLQLTTNYLPALLAPLSLVSVFELALSLGFSRRQATAALVAQLVALVMLVKLSQPGLVFFDRLTLDKVVVAYLLAPAGLAAAANWCASTERCRLSQVGLIYLAIAFGHPTMFGIAYLVLLGYCGAEFVVGAARARVVRLGLLITALAAAVSMLRLVDHPSQAHVHFTIASADRSQEMIHTRTTHVWVSADRRHYAVPSRILSPAAVVIGLLILPIAVLQMRSQRAARYVAPALALIGLTLMPPTAWLVGLTITPFHLWRISWFAPFGIGLVLAASVIAGAVRDRFASRHRFAVWALRRSVAAWCELALLGAVVAVVHVTHLPRLLSALHAPPDWRAVAYTESEGHAGKAPCRRTYADLIEMGRVIDQRVPRGAVMVGGPGDTNEFIPSVSARVRLVAFRGADQTMLHAGVSQAAAAQRFAGVRALFGAATGPAGGQQILSDLGVDYVLHCGEWATAPPRVRLEATVGNLRLYRVEVEPNTTRNG
jgi:hypothetical protein